MANRLRAIDYAEIMKQIEETLESYGLSFYDFLSHMEMNRFSEYEKTDCCSQVDAEIYRPEGELLLDDVDEFDWPTRLFQS
ncbi:MAG: hypothetical protein ACXAAO_08645 [Candidatus Thorarchaeota archaeon]|jgi:hypothetical protein